MACGMQFLRWLSDNGYLPPKGRLLDIGESCLLAASLEDFKAILVRHGCKISPAELPNLLDTFVVRSNTFGNPEMPTLFLCELLELTNIEYVSFDVVVARKAHHFDLNIHSLNSAKQKTFDICLNFGTTEHLVNQFNAFKVMHEAVKPGGYIFHQVPATGYINHGYFNYHPLMFRELAEANLYETVALWYYAHGTNASITDQSSSYLGKHQTPGELSSERPAAIAVPNSVLNVLFRKVQDTHFKVRLEVATAAGIPYSHQVYNSEYINHFALPTPKPLTPSSLLRRIIRKLAG